MTDRNSPKLGDKLLDDPIAWGRKLIETEDHDPLYTGLVNWNVKDSRKRRFLLAYWCCYSVGAPHYMSRFAGDRFWEILLDAAKNVTEAPYGGRWPRAHERRHWRGQKAVDSAIWLRNHYNAPEYAVIELENFQTLQDVEKQITCWPQFGPWIAFKAADMLERVMGCSIRFPDDLVSMYKDPQQGAELAAKTIGAYDGEQVVEMMKSAYADCMIPGKEPRRAGIQEIETVLCKWKSAKNGKYWIGADTASHRAELENWKAHDLLGGYPTVRA